MDIMDTSCNIMAPGTRWNPDCWTLANRPSNPIGLCYVSHVRGALLQFYGRVLQKFES